MGGCQELIRRYPSSRFKAGGLFWQGMLQRDAGKMQDAEESLRASLKSNPDPELAREASFYLAVLLEGSGRADEAAGMFQALLSTPAKEKFTPAILQWLAEYWIAKKENAKGAEAAQILVGATGDPAWQQTGWGLRGRALLAGGAADEADAAFKKALSLKAKTPLAAEAALRLGEISLAANRPKEAGEYFKQASEMASDDAQIAVRARAYVGLARTAGAASDFGAAARYYMSVAVLYDDPELVPECLFEAARAFRQVGDPKSADAAIKELQTRYPDSAWSKKTKP